MEQQENIMNINFEIEGDNQVWDLLDGFFLAILKEELKNELSSYGDDKLFNGDDDIADSKERVEALKVLIRFHTTQEEYELFMKQIDPDWVQTWTPKSEMWE